MTKVHIAHCKECERELRLLKDSTEGMAVYCGDCWVKLEKEVGKK